jgi:hypothetical protein
MKPGPLIMLLLGSIMSLFAFGLVSAGVVAAIANNAQGPDGYFSTRTVSFSTGTHALTTPRFGSDADTATVAGAPIPRNLDIARIRLEATSPTGNAVFIGIAPRADVEEYLAGVPHSEVRDIRADPVRVRYAEIPGPNRPGPPAEQDFWVESASGSGNQEVTWPVQPGSWAVVVMNADAGRSVDVDVQAGLRIGLLGPLATALLIVGILTLVIGLVLAVLGVIGLGRGGPAPPNRTGSVPGVPVRA